MSVRAAEHLFAFDHPHAVAPRELTGLLGGKGAGLAEMTSVLGLPVPPGFTVGLPVCLAYRRDGWPADLDDALAAHVAALETRIGRRLGDPADPLLVAVRSGAPRSMPGMLDTVLNLGLTDATVDGLAAVSGDAVFAWDSYRRFLTMYATTVLGVPQDALPAGAAPTDEAGLRARVADLKARIAAAGAEVPQDPARQLRGAVEAVFRSWDSPRARAYRAHEGIDDDLGTAVNVQAMVFGNRDDRSGTGVVFTRDPATGENRAYGDFLPRAQGEDVVAGTARTLTLADMAARLPEAHRELSERLGALERHYRDMCDVEFTVESGTLFILQTRVGKRGAVAAVRLAAELAADPSIALTRDEARARLDDATIDRARAEVVAAARRGAAAGALVRGLGASPGRVSGAVVLDADAAADAEGPVVLVRPETNPEDVHGMAVSVGILTSTGGLVSHAAVVARGWGIPAVVGAQELVVGPADVRTREGEVLFATGDTITIDGTTGEVWLGAATDDGGTAGLTDDEIVARDLPALAVLLGDVSGQPVARTSSSMSSANPT
ncbi:PEP/pyruvate-binding domain-containing protein [Pseudonocardia sulfidoxydans]|uniref:PEP/pyruvate-binding domain-containing protein n=1 Tax=Pseudonocardia sulfidoxydans TaxID=54011 RepID=UPI001649D93D|nr:PEP/pyruvate-binding domain-containing protein [Pseudonocardia sulfidoxydans]